jgi:hypothetical protein
METHMNDEADQPSPEREYDLTLKGAGVTIERRIPESLALSVVALVMGGVPASNPLRRPASVQGLAIRPAVVGQGVTVGEFMTAVEAKRNPDKILAFGAFISDELSRPTFTRDEVRSMFQQAAEPLPANFHRDFTWAVSNRWLGEQVGTPGAYYVTGTGRKALETKFAAEIKAATKLPRRRRARKPGNVAAAANGGEDAS